MEVPSILVACHDSACGGHFPGQFLGQKILRACYFWPTLFKDVHEYVKRCDACQRYVGTDLQNGDAIPCVFIIGPFGDRGDRLHRRGPPPYFKGNGLYNGCH